MKLNYKELAELIKRNIVDYTIVNTHYQLTFLTYELEGVLEDSVVINWDGNVMYNGNPYYKDNFIRKCIYYGCGIKYIIVSEHLNKYHTISLVENCKWSGTKIIVVNTDKSSIDYNFKNNYSDLFTVLDLNTENKIYNFIRKEKIKVLLNGNKEENRITNM